MSFHLEKMRQNRKRMDDKTQFTELENPHKSYKLEKLPKTELLHST